MVSKKNWLPTLSSNNRKIIDLIATFKPEILDVFEDMFLEFASDSLINCSKYSSEFFVGMSDTFISKK